MGDLLSEDCEVLLHPEAKSRVPATCKGPQMVLLVTALLSGCSQLIPCKAEARMQVAKKLMLFYVEQDGPSDLSTPACLQHYKVWRTNGY